MKTKKINSLKIYQDSKELPFCIYKKILQTGDFFYLIKGYDPYQKTNANIDVLKAKFDEIEEDYATSMNMRNADVTTYGELAVVTNEFNKFNILQLFIEEAIRCQELRLKLEAQLDELIFDLIEEGKQEEINEIEALLSSLSPENSEFNSENIKNLLKDFKVQKSDNLYEQSQFIQKKLDKLQNQILKLNSQIKTKECDQDNSEFDIEEQFVSVCLGLELPVDDSKITLYQYGLMIKALINRVDELNKLNKHGR